MRASLKRSPLKAVPILKQATKISTSTNKASPDPPILVFFFFFDFLALFSFSDFPCFFVRFPFFSKDFRGSAKRKALAFSG